MFRLVPSQLEVGHCFSMCNISTEKKAFPGHWSWPWCSMTLITHEQTGNCSINVYVRVHFLYYGWRMYSAGVLKHTYLFSHSTTTKTKQYYNNNKIMITNQNKNKTWNGSKLNCTLLLFSCIAEPLFRDVGSFSLQSCQNISVVVIRE